MVRRLSFPLLLLLVACDQPTEEERRAMMTEVATEVAQAKVAAVEGKLDAQVEEAKGQTKRIDELEKQVAELSSQLVSAQSQVAEAQVDIEALKKEHVKPTPEARPGRPDPEAYYAVKIGNAQARGPDDALVTIVTWSDFQCPYCSRVSPTIDSLLKTYGGDLRYVFKHNPLGFHTNARPAAIAAEAAGEQGKFFEMHDKLFANQRDLTEKNFIAWARELGLDVKKFKRDLDSATIADRVDRQQQEGMALGARGTPSFFINGRFLSGAQPETSFKALIDDELGKARAKVAAGTARNRVYDETIAGGRTEP
ncbi:MAG: thioredoxin domain-containing protein [Myxococcales bacterium]|nr:thioredoxin domain-containing protein [Myxococcales bacterium]